MKNIFGIFRADFRRISSSVVASVVIIGLCLVPCLYAWFNILSNWDPYGPASTSNIKVAVANEDRGAKLMGMELNIGSLVMDGLAANNQLGWVFVDDRQTALEGVYSGDYYAALIVSKDFTQDFLSILDNDLRHPQIEYYENEKKNAIAPKITNKAKTAVQEQVNNTVVEKAAGAINTMSSVMRAFGIDANDVSGSLTSGLDRACDNLEQISKLLVSLRTVTANMDSLLDASQLTLNDLGDVMLTSAGTADAAGITVVDFADSMNSYSKDTDAILTKIDSQFSNLLDQLERSGTDEARKDNYRNLLSTLDTDILAAAALSIADIQTDSLMAAATDVETAITYVDTIETDSAAAAALLQSASDKLAEAANYQALIDSSMSSLSQQAQDLSSEAANWCSMLQNEADMSEDGMPSDESIADAVNTLSPLIGDFISEINNSTITAPGVENVLSLAQELEMSVADIGTEEGRSSMLYGTSDIVNELYALSSTQTSMPTTLADLKTRTDELQAKAADWKTSEAAKQDVIDAIDQLEESLREYKAANPGSAAAVDSAIASLESLRNLISADSSDTSQIFAKLDEVREALYTAAITANDNINSYIQDKADTAESVLTTVRDMLYGYSGKMYEIAEKLDGYHGAIGSMQGTLSDSIALTNSVRIYLKQIADDIRRFTNSEAFQELVEILENNPDSLADYLASPVELNTVVIYEIKDYGSAMAPYYIMLALFVGSLLSATMIKVPVKYPEYLDCSPIERYFGRKMLFNGIVLAQAIITALGCMFYVGMQSVNPLLLILACCICSLNFMAMNYALVYSLDNVGMAAAVIIMVIQVAGSGGSYPVHVLPEFFQKLYNFMPFHYGMDMIRETIGGFYGHTYLKCAAILLLMCVGFAIFGLLVYYPAKPINKLIAESKEKSGIM